MKYLFLLTFLTSLLSSEILVTSETKEINLLKKSSFYYSKDTKKTIQSLITQPEEFQSLNVEYLNFGYTKSPVWIKFTLHNSSSKKIDQVINIDNILIETIELYTLNNDKITNTQYVGSLHREKFSGIIMPNIPITLQPNSKQTYILKVFTSQYSLHFQLKLFSKEKFLSEDIKKHIIWALFIGVLFTVIFYNLFLFISTKDTIYFYYFLYLLSILLMKEFSVILMLYLFPMENPYYTQIDTQMLIYYINFTIMSMTLFVRSFLNTKLYPKIDFMMKALIILPIINSIISLLDLQLLKIETISQINFIIFFIYFFIGLYALSKGNKNALYFVIGWGIGIMGWLSITLQWLNIWNIKYNLFYYTSQTLLMIEVLLFSFAIASRIKKLKNEKYQLSQSLLKQKESENIRLENLVEEKTHHLNLELKNNQLLLKELHHRIKNNMQFISSLYSLKLNTGDHDSELSLKIQDVESKIYAMNQVHELLYNQENVSNIETENYFEKIINQITTLYNTDNIYFSLYIKTKLNVEEAIYCGLIVNELVTNSIKYAFEDMAIGKIHISLEEKDNFKNLTISDNGKGIDKDTSHNGFGEIMVETLATIQLDGTINIKSQNGTTTQIVFPNQKYNTKYND